MPSLKHIFVKTLFSLVSFCTRIQTHDRVLLWQESKLGQPRLTFQSFSSVLFLQVPAAHQRHRWRPRARSGRAASHQLDGPRFGGRPRQEGHGRHREKTVRSFPGIPEPDPIPEIWAGDEFLSGRSFFAAAAARRVDF